MDKSLYGPARGHRSILAAIALLIFVGGVAGASRLAASRLPAAKVARADLNRNGVQERYVLCRGRLLVTEGTGTLWQSPAAWRVDDFTLGDADNDGTVELLLSVWRRGSFGRHRPFWFRGEDAGYKNHLFVYRLAEDTVKPVWLSSNLDRPVISMAVKDVDGDRENELVVQEGTYRSLRGEVYTADTRNARTVILRWDEWGFTVCNKAGIP